MKIKTILEGLRDPQDNPCWKGYHPVGTKEKDGRTVPNCVPNANEGVEEASPEATFNTLKGLKSWQVVIMNNYYRGKYSDYSGRYYYVLASSPEEARQVVLDNADAILQDLLSMKSVNGKKILPRGSAVRITADRIGDIRDGTEAGRMTTAGFKRMFGPQGPMMVKLNNGAIADVQGQEQGVAEGVTPASTSKVLRLIQRHRADWFDTYGIGEVEDTVVDMADMGQFSGMSAADALELVGQELESLYGQQGVMEGSDNIRSMIQQYEDMVELVYDLPPGRKKNIAIDKRDALEAQIEAMPGGKEALRKWAKSYNDAMDEGVAEGVEIIDQDSDLDQQVYTLNVDGNKVSFTYWDYENNFQSPDIKDIYQQAKEQLGKKLSPEQIKAVARAVFKSFKQGVAEAAGLYGPFTVTINTGERPQSRTKTKKFRREDDAILWAQDWLEDFPQYSFATVEVTDPDGNVVWTTDESLEEGDVTRTPTGLIHRAKDKYGAGEDDFQYNGGRSGFGDPGKYARDLDGVNKQLVKDLDASMGITWKNRGTNGVEVDEARPQEKEADYGDEYQAMVARVKKLAGLGPLKTVWDPQKRVYKNVPVAQQPGDKK